MKYPSPDPSGVSVDDAWTVARVLQILWRYRLVVLLSTVLVPLAAFAYSATREKQYTATASMLFRDSATAALDPQTVLQPTDPERDAATNTDLASLPVVAERAAETLKTVSAGQVKASISVKPRDQSSIVEVSAETPSPQLSARMANAYVVAYIAFRREADRRKLQVAISLVQRNLEALPAERRNGEEGRMVQRRLERLSTAQSLQTGNAEIVQRATPPTSPSSPKTMRNVLLGLLLGLVLGVALAIVFDRLDRRYRTAEDLEAAFQLPVLAVVPRSRSLRHGTGQPLEPAVAEAFRTLRLNLRFFDGGRGRPLKTIAITSPLPGEGKSTVARDLAITMAEYGDRVVLVETDLHKTPASAELLDRDAVGLSTLLAGHATIDEAIVPIDVPGARGADEEAPNRLDVLPAGLSPPNPSELIQSERMRAVLEELEQRYDAVIVDTPALAVVSDAVAILPRLDGVVLVGAVGTTTKDGVRAVRRPLSLSGVRALGLVVNMAPLDREGHSGYGYYRASRKQGGRARARSGVHAAAVGEPESPAR